MLSKSILTAVILGAIAPVAAGCGGDDEGETTAAEETTEEAGGGGEITVTADEYSFELSDTPAAGPTTFRLDNVGEERHELIFAQLAEDATADDAIQAQGEKGTTELTRRIVAGPGQEAKQTIDAELEPANYLLVCALSSDGKPHFTLGQREEFEITE